MTRNTTRWAATPPPATALQTPYQAPAVDRNPAASHAGHGDSAGVEADLSWADIPWHSLGKAAKGALDAVL
ncbi:hypothetical protein ABT330_31655 [Streptomyces sp. NPDC000658]|uniref:hypothetical protein n=1 Tax=Streptomyces sp. NPDC000658 TaxID=3154266 RepID=UPI00332D4170